MASRIVVAYPFHPLHGQLLEVVSTPRHREGAVTVRDPEGKRLKVPAWMLDDDVSRVQLANQVTLSVAALQALDELICLQPLCPLAQRSQTHHCGLYVTNSAERDDLPGPREGAS